jgi:hypothetical protein
MRPRVQRINRAPTSLPEGGGLLDAAALNSLPAGLFSVRRETGKE